MKTLSTNPFAHLDGAATRTKARPRVALTLSQILPVLIAGLGLVSSGEVTAQTFSTLHSFTAVGSYPNTTNSDGANPAAGLTLSGNGSTLYGTTPTGGSGGNGTVFAVNTDGTGFATLHSFTTANVDPSSGRSTNSDGRSPAAGLILWGDTLYGVAENGGGSGYGTVFKLNTDGTGFTNLHSFTGVSDGAYPVGGLIISGDTLYGATGYGGSAANGTVFKLNTNGTGFANLHSFTGGAYGNGPRAGLILSGNTLYGTALGVGSSLSGAVFALNTDGSGFTNLYSFTALSPYDPSNPQTNSDGAYPVAGLILSGSTLYGTAKEGGSSGNGTVFAVNTDGTGFTNLHSFTANYFPYSNSDGANPFAGLLLSGNTLYGTAYQGGSSRAGTLFAVNTDGSGFSNLHSFSFTGVEAYWPKAGLILSGNTFYGTASRGGSDDKGTVFSLSFTPQLTIAPSGPNVIVSWPTNVAGFDYTVYTLQSTTNLLLPAAWVTNSPAPVVINGRNTVTNPIAGAQQFYRLVQ